MVALAELVCRLHRQHRLTALLVDPSAIYIDPRNVTDIKLKCFFGAVRLDDEGAYEEGINALTLHA